MWLPYNTNQELTHISMIFTYWIPWIYQQYTWIAVTATLIALLPLCLWIYQVYCSEKWWRFIEATVVYPRPNIYVAWFLDFRSVLNFYKDTGVLIVLIIICHYLYFFIISKIMLFLLIVFIPINALKNGYNDSLSIVIFIFLLNLGYYYDFGVGLPVLPPHYYVNWLSFLNHGNPVTINPYNFIIDANKYMYVYALLLLYVSIIRHSINFFYWKKVKYIPYKHKKFEYFDDFDCNQRIKKIHKLRKQLIQKRNKSIKAGTYVPRAKVKLTQGSKEPLGSSNSQSIGKDTSNNTERSLKLLGFKQQAIKVMIAEYGVDTLEKALDKLDMLDDLTTPKNNFLETLQDTHDNIL